MRSPLILLVMGAALFAPLAASAQPAAPAPAAVPAPPPAYGPAVTLDQAKRIVAAAEAEARKHGYAMAFAVVEPSGDLVFFEKMDNTQYGSIAIAQGKAKTAALFKRPSKAFGDALTSGRTAILSFDGVIAVEGGIPIVVDGRIIGAIGASGGSSEQDGAMAAAGLAALR
ncbi:MAG: heme-binding protein [Proteobacteria bacterium]|nr:heme-binding protein [Pseudomonadota bacterium]